VIGAERTASIYIVPMREDGADPTAVVVVADDLTGAADTGAGLSLAGLRTIVTWPELAPEPLSNVDAVALDAGSRILEPGAAAAATEGAVAWAKRHGAQMLYKKCDSLLRGHIGIEVAASRRVWDAASIAIVAPAFPAADRTTLGGRQRAVGKDVGAPLELLAAAGLTVVGVELHDVRSGRLHEILEGAANGGAQAVILDALTADDLSEIAGAGLRLTRPVVWAGTGGLVRALAARAFPAPAARVPGRQLRIEPRRRGPILVVCGSASAVAREQVSRLKSAGVDGFDVDAALLLDAGQAGARRFADSAEHHLRQGRDLVVSLSTPAEMQDRRVAEALAAVLSPCGRIVGGLVATGGDTATAMLRSWGTTSLRLVGETEPGVAIAVASGAQAVVVATKAGAFGGPDALVRAAARLREMMNESTGAG
jgi:D-threonate/D-erythronate kinase